MRITRVLPWLLLAGLVVLSVAVYPALRAEIPRSVDFNGRVTHRVTKSPWAWGLLPAVAVFTQLLMEGIRRALPRKPELFNFPGKDDLLKLPPELRAPIIVTMQWFMDVVACVTLVVLLAVQLTMWHAARGGRSDLASIVVMMLCVLMPPLLLLLLQRVTNQVDAAKRVWESRRNPLANEPHRGAARQATDYHG